MKILLILTCIYSMTFFASNTDAEADSESNTDLPLSWYTQPEDFPEISLNDFLKKEESPPNEEVLGSLLDTTALSLEEYSKENALIKRDKSETQWNFSSLLMTITVSIRGMLGVLAGKGKSKIELFWKQKDQTQVDNDAKDTIGSHHPVSLNQNLSEDEVVEKVLPIVNALAVAGKVEDKEKFRSDYLKKVIEHHKMFYKLAVLGSNKWEPSSFYLFIRFNAAGMITPNVSLNGSLISTLVWFIDKDITKKPQSLNLNLTPKEKKKRESLQNYSYNMATHLDNIDESKINKQDFYLAKVNLSIGVHAAGGIGSIFVAGGVSAGITFTKRTEILNKKKLTPTAIYFEYIEKNPTKKHLKYATKNKIEFNLYQTDEGQEAVYKILYKNFEKGTKKAVKMANFVSKISNKLETKKWYIQKIDTRFSLSLTGSVTFGSLGMSNAIKFKLRRLSERRNIL